MRLSQVVAGTLATFVELNGGEHKGESDKLLNSFGVTNGSFTAVQILTDLPLGPVQMYIAVWDRAHFWSDVIARMHARTLVATAESPEDHGHFSYCRVRSFVGIA